MVSNMGPSTELDLNTSNILWSGQVRYSESHPVQGYLSTWPIAILVWCASQMDLFGNQLVGQLQQPPDRKVYNILSECQVSFESFWCLSLSTYVIIHIIYMIYINTHIWMNISDNHSLGKEIAIRVKQLCSRWCVSPRNGWPILYFGWCPAHSDIGEWNSLLWAKMENLMTVLNMDLWALLG
jgi:hypothetical protein